MAKTILREIKDSNNPNYIGRIFYKTPWISTPITNDRTYYAEIEDSRNGNKNKKKIGIKYLEWNYPFHIWDVKIESLEFTSKGLEVKCAGNGKKQDIAIVQRPNIF